MQREFILYSSDEERSSKDSNHMETSDAEEDIIFSDTEEETVESKVEPSKVRWHLVEFFGCTYK